ncbi:MAG TPA: formimidoylglutamase [Prolixibacteraceae bacterium]|nr:formimidoylglutamase [Prolixibacteraceae bacterium]
MVKDKLDEILGYFDPVQLTDFTDSSYLNDSGSIGSGILCNSSVKPIAQTEKFEIALVFVDPELNEISPSKNPIREEFYKLKKVSYGLRIADLGNLRTGKNLDEAQFILQEVCALLFQLKINVVVVGGPQLLTTAIFKAIKEFENDINLVHIDSRIDLSVSDELCSEDSYLDKIIANENSHLYNISCIGHQAYFVDPKQINRLNELYFEHYRLGATREKLENIEPILRDADLVSFDIGAIKAGDAPARKNSSPNGFFADEACQLTRYIGISDRNRVLGIFEMDHHLDDNNQTAKLIAQMVWYYLDGFINRKHEYPQTTLEDCIKYIVEIDEIEIPIVFYKSNKTQRWWIEVNNLPESMCHRENVTVACTETDYFKACSNEIPDRWWINFKKLR